MDSSEKTEEILKKLYYDPSKGFINARAMYAKLKEQGNPITHKVINEFIKKQDVVQRYKPNLNVEYFPVYSSRLNHFSADLMFFPKYKSSNNNTDTFLTLMNVNTKMGYIEPVKNKQSASVAQALAKLIKDNNLTIDLLEVDLGGEFNDCTKLVKEIKRTDRKNHRGLIIERFNKTIRDKVNKYIRVYGAKFIDQLPALVANYNNTVHSATGIDPAKMTVDKERNYILDQARETAVILERYKQLFPVGQLVRKVKTARTFEKDNTLNTKKTYKVVGWDKLRVVLDDDSKEMPQNLLPIDQVQTAPAVQPVETAKVARKVHKKEVAIKKTVNEIGPDRGYKEATPISDRASRALLRKKKVFDL